MNENQGNEQAADGRIRIFIDDKPFFAPKPVMTGAELKALGGVPTEYQLFEEVHGPGDDRLIRDDEQVHLKSGDKFYGQPPGNLG